MRFAVLAAALALAAAPVWAQHSYPRHNFTGGVGGAFPRSDLASVMQSAPGVSVGYGYRFARYLQADTGLEVLFGAAGVREFESTQIGTFRIKDREYFVPLGGRGIVPLLDGRLLIHGGGGAAFMKYSESLNQPSSYYKVGCVTCTTRSGWGYYAQVGFDYFMWSTIRLGVMTRSYQGHTDGEPIGSIPGVRTADHWMSTQAQIGFSF